MTIRWQTIGIAREYRLFQEKQIVGLLKNNFWNRQAYGELRGHLMRIVVHRYGKRHARILDIEGQQLLGTIEFHFSPRSATIYHDNQRYHWTRADKKTPSGWSIYLEAEKTEYDSADFLSTEGTITTPYLHPVVMLTGLFVQGYFLKRRMLIGGAVLAVFLVALLLVL
jgi:hypothetical protein